MNSRKVPTMVSKDHDIKDNEGRIPIKVAERPTFILKTREGENRAVSPSQRSGSKKEPDTQANVSTKPSESRMLMSIPQEMPKCIKFMDENFQLCENVLEYLLDQQDFLVVGVLGTQGVGKSTILSLLTSNYASDIFGTENLSHHKNGSNCTTGIDLYVTKNRVIFLDTQPILSSFVMTTTASTSEPYVSADYNPELQSLQFAAFLYSICHVIIFVQDWFVDPNLIRFLQTAEMLKPSSTSNLDQDYVEYYPHIIFLHNKAESQDFIDECTMMMRCFYRDVFASSRLQIHSGLDMRPYPEDRSFNLFLLPKMNLENIGKQIFRDTGEILIERLRNKIYGFSRNPLTPSALTEKNWYHYASKVMEAIKKSHFSLEYGRLLP